MFYSSLGRVVWFGAKWYLRRRYGRAYFPKPVLASGVIALVLAVALLGKSQSS
jgi:hypothetical protein